MTNAPASNIDGIRMAMLTARFNGIARKMSNTLFRTGRSGILNIAHDFSCAVLTADCTSCSPPPRACRSTSCSGRK